MATDGKTFLGDGLVNGGVVRSVDGKTWSQVEALPGWGYQAAFVDGLIQLAANSEAVSRSTDGGQTWEALESAALGSVFRFERGVPLSGPGGSEPRLFAWSVNGLFESADDGLTWAPSTDTLRAQFSDVLEVKGRTVVRDGGNLQVIQGGVPVGLPLPGGLVTSLHPVGDTVAIQDGEGRVRQFHGGAWSPASKVAFIGLGTVDGELLGYINSIVFAGAAAPSNDGPLAFDEVGAFQTYESIGRVFATDTHLFVSSTPWMGDSCGGKGPSALESGGLFRWDGDDQWTQAVGGMPVTQQSCAWGPRYPEPRALIDTGDALLVATVTHGAFRSTNDGDDWSPVTGLPVNAAQLLFATGGGSTVAVDAATATLYRQAIPGLFVDEGPVAGLSPSARVTAVALVPGALLVGVTDTARRSADQGLWVSTDDGESFTRVDIAGAGVASLAVAGDTVFVGTAGAGAFRISVSALLAPGEACEAESRAAERGE